MPHGCNDTDRLLAGELVYTGVGRTPICAITDWLPWRDARCPVAAEVFATAADAYVILGDLPEQPTDTSTADGRPLTKEFARERLARMICADARHSATKTPNKRPRLYAMPSRQIDGRVAAGVGEHAQPPGTGGPKRGGRIARSELGNATLFRGRLISLADTSLVGQDQHVCPCPRGGRSGRGSILAVFFPNLAEMLDKRRFAGKNGSVSGVSSVFNQER